MTKREFYLPSSDGEYKLRCLEWLPDGEVRAVLQITHGMIEHIGRYDEFAAGMAENGIAVVGHDHLGHGKTAKSTEDFGFFGTDGSSTPLIRDIRRLTKYAKRRYEGKQLFLLGHSMGSFLTRMYLTRYKDGPDGVILLGTGFPNTAVVYVGWLLSSLICKVKGERYISRLLHELSLGNYNRQFKPNKTGYDWLTKDTDKAKEYEEDPLCRFLFTAGAYRSFFEVILKAEWAEKQGKMRTNMPVLFLSGDRDPVGDRSKGVRRVYRFYSEAGCKDLTLGFYRDARHEILNETNRQEVYQDILCWLEDHIDSEARTG